MSHDPILIPPPPVVRQRLATLYREGRLLRSLLRLALRAAEERHDQATAPTTREARRVGVSQ
jgi:hypothetical protein